MKKIYLFVLVIAAIATSCTDGKKKEFVERVASYVEANQVDLLKHVYPEADFDSIGFTGEYENIEISPIEGSDNYIAKLGETAYIEFETTENGTMTIVKSKGLALFPKDKLKIAKQTGMLNDNLSDTEIDKLLKDNEYFKWLAKKSESSMNKIIKIDGSKVKYGTCYGEGTYALSMTVTLTNTSQFYIDGTDYNVNYTLVVANCSDGSIPDSYALKKESGVNLNPGETKTITINGKGYRITNPKIKWNLSPQAIAKFVTYTGKEYSEYKNHKDKLFSEFPTEGSLAQFEFLSSNMLTSDDLEAFSPSELRLLRNAIFARHGYIFQSADLRKYFSNFDDYSPMTRNVIDLNTIENANVALIKANE